MSRSVSCCSKILQNSKDLMQFPLRAHSSALAMKFQRRNEQQFLLSSHRCLPKQCTSLDQHFIACNYRNILYRHYSDSTPQKSSSFFGKILQNLKEDDAKAKEFREEMEKFKSNVEEMTKSDTAIRAREKFQKIEAESAEGREKAMQQLGKLKQKVADAEVMQKASKMKEGAKETVQKVGQNLSDKGEELSKTQAYKAVSSTASIVRDEIASSALSGAGMTVYNPPKVLRLRCERNPEAEERIIKANTSATGVELHKDSRFSQGWQDFKDNNPYVNRVLEWKTKLDESDHMVVRAGLLAKDKMMDVFNSVFENTSLSAALTEICKVDPNFNKDEFLLLAEYDFIPNILEAMTIPDLTILQDWTSERVFAVIAKEYEGFATLGHKKYSRVLDVDNVDLAMGEVIKDVGPIMAINFQAQMVEYIKNPTTGEIISGDPNQVLRKHYIWMLCRDMQVLEPRSAWKLVEYGCHTTAQLL